MPVHNFDAFQVIADPSRRQILMLLSKDRLTINSLAEHFEMSRPAVSKHIKILDHAGFVNIENIGRERYCTLQQDGFNELQQWMEYFDNFWASKLQNLQNLMNQNNPPNKEK